MKKYHFLTVIICLFTFSCSFLSTPTPQIIKETIEVEITKEVTREVSKEVIITATPEPTHTPTQLPPLLFEEISKMIMEIGL